MNELKATRLHAVQEGDTLSQIARKNNTSTAELLRLNPGLQTTGTDGQPRTQGGDLIYPGDQVIVLPPLSRDASNIKDAVETRGPAGGSIFSPNVLPTTPVTERIMKSLKGSGGESLHKAVSDVEYELGENGVNITAETIENLAEPFKSKVIEFLQEHMAAMRENLPKE
jgi:hypothetical protein